jgi:arylsulfatase A-like enzyme
MKILRLASLALVSGTAWVFMEWLFFVTKPSFMSLYPWMEKLAVLSGTALIVAVSLLIVTLPFAATAALLHRLNANVKVVSMIALLPAILLLAMAMMVVLDNFTLTLFSWGIRDSSGFVIYAYRLVTVALVFLAARLLDGFLVERYSPGTLKNITFVALVLVACSIPLLWISVAESTDEDFELAGSRQELPNIVILSADGLSANHMSLYGYERPTTPFMDRMRGEFLVAENHFSNASDTGGSVISLLSGKLPTTTRVIYPPDVLRGTDSYRHLPGILKNLGYYNADVSMRHYADPYDLNLRGGFHEANFRRLKETGGTLVAAIRKIPALNPASLLLDRISERVSERFGHIWKDKPMRNPMAEVNEPDKRWLYDDGRMAEIRRLLSESPRPLFLHVHMMGTHGEKFRPSKRVYSTEEDYETLWHIGSYDDAIMDFDRNVEETYQLLEDSGLLDSTVLIISSDHGYQHRVLDRLPLLMRLPGKSKTGSIGGNTQRLDIAPTVLDIIGIRPPGWMEGRTLLDSDDSYLTNRLIFANGSQSDKFAREDRWSVRNPQPPWYSLGRQYLINCDKGFKLLLNTMEMSTAQISGSTVACDETLSESEARVIMLDHLREKSYSWE